MKKISILQFFIVPVLFLSTQVIMSSEDNDLAGERAFSNSTNFASETLFSASDFGRKTMHIFKSSNYRLTRAVNYQPSTEVSSSPMIKVTASSVTVDLNGFTVSRQDTDVNGVTCPNAVGIEIGFSPYDIAQSKFGASATFNPENVTIKNGVLDNFGIGIVIHAGVKNVVLEDLTITRSALGVVCAGQSTKQVASVTLKNVTITGDGTDRSAFLTWAKSKLEVTHVTDGDMQYGNGNIMPEQDNPVAVDTGNDVYSGVLLVYTNTATLDHVTCNNLGEETNADTFTFPVYARNSSNLTLQDVTVSGSKSDSMVAGIVCDTCSFVAMNNIISTNNSNTNTVTTMGLYFKGAATNISIDGAQVNNNSGTSVRGIYFAGAAANMSLKNIDVLNSTGTFETTGAIYFASTLDNASMENVRVQGTTGGGSDTFGLYVGDNVTVLKMIDCAFDDISCATTGAGIRFQGTVKSLYMDGVAIRNISNTGTIVDGIYFNGVFSDSKMHHVSVGNITATTQGSGIRFNNTVTNVLWDDVTIQNITGGTAAYGFLVANNQTVTNVDMKNVSISGITGSNGLAAGIYFSGYIYNTNLDTVSVQELHASGVSGTVYGIKCIDTGTAHNIRFNAIDCGGFHAAVTAYGLLLSPSGPANAVQITNSSFHDINAAEGAYGICANNTLTNAQIENINIQYIYSTSELAEGIYFHTSVDQVQLYSISILGVQSEKAHGIHFNDDASAVQMSDINILGTQGSIDEAGGIFFAGVVNAGVSFKNIVCTNTTVSGTTVNTCAYGIKMNSGNALTFDNVNCSYNVGPNATQDTNISTAGAWNTVSCAGVWLVNSSAVEMKNITCDYNTLGGTSAAAYTFGILLDNPSDVTMDSVSCSHNVGNAHVSGLFINGGQSVQVLSGQFNDNIMQGTHDADVQTNAVIITPNGNISKHSVLPEASVDAIGWLDEYADDELFDAPESLKGAFGIFVYGLPQNSTDQFKNLLLRDVTANNNNGFRALGIELLSCKNVEMYEITTIGNQAHGELFLDHTDDELSQHTIAGNSSYYVGRAVTIPARYVSSSLAISPDIFGIDFNPIIDVVDVQKTMQNVLNEITYLKDGFGLDTHSQIYGHYSVFVNSEILLRSIVAKKRAWGNAVGVQVQNSSNVLIDGVNASGNTAQRDSAFGILFANHCTDCSVLNAQCNANTAWTDSGIEYRAGTNVGTIDITAMNPFWAAMDVRLPNPDHAGYINSAHANYGTLTTADVNADGRFVVQLYNGSTTKELCTPCGPIAAGIVIGDTSERISIQDSVCAGNNGNAGQAYGILHDVSTNAVVQNSKVFQNLCNTCGIAFGIAEFTPESGSIHFANTAFGNQYENFLNSNYLVPFDPDGPAEFPVKVGFNGDVSPLINASVYDNIEVRFMNTLPADPTNLPDGVSAYWSAQFMVGFPGGTYDNPLHASMTATSNTTGTANANAVVFDVDYTRGAYENIGSLTVIDPIGGWNVVIDTVVGSANLHVNEASQAVAISGTAHLEREGFESITGITFSGTVYVNVTHLGLVTLDDDHVDEYDIANSSLLHFEGNEYIEGNVPIDFYTRVYTSGQFYVNNITTRTITNFTLSGNITNSANDQSTVPFNTMTSFDINTNFAGWGTNVLTSSVLSSNNNFAWYSVSSTNVSTNTASFDSLVDGNTYKDVKFTGSINYDINTLGLPGTDSSDSIDVTDVNDNHIATFYVSSSVNVTPAAYTLYNPAARTANITFDYTQDENSTVIDNPLLGALNSDIFVGYTLSNVDLDCSVDVLPGGPGLYTNQTIAVTGTGQLIDSHDHTIDVVFSGNVYVQVDELGIPIKNTGQTSALTVTTAGDETDPNVVIAQITLGTFTFDSQTNRSGGAFTGTSNMSGTSATNAIEFAVSALASLPVLEGWTLTVNTISGTDNLDRASSEQAVIVTGTATLSKAGGYTSVSDIAFSGSITVDTSNLGIVTFSESSLHFTKGARNLDFYVEPSSITVTNNTTRVLTNFTLSGNITNSGANETTVPLTSMTSATMSLNLGGVGTVISVANLTSSNNTFAWDASEESSIASTGDTCTLGGISVNLASGTIDLAADTIGRITVNDEADAIELHDASDRLVATLDITGASLTASYSGFNTAARTANMTFNYNQDTDSATIDTPVLGALSSAIFNGYTLTSVSLSCSAGNDIAPSQNEASFTVSGAAVLDEDGGAGLYNVTISGTVYVDTSNFGVPTKGSTASVLTVTDDETSAVIAQITLGSFTFNSQTTRSATIAATSNTQSSTTTQIIFTGMTLASTIEGWTVNVDFKDTAYTVNTNQINQAINISAADPTTVTLTKGGQTTITNLTISGVVLVNVSNLGIVTIGTAGFTVTSTNGAGIDFDITSNTMNVTNITARNITLALDTAITNSGTDQSTIVLEPTDGIATMTTIGGVDIVTSAFSFAVSNVFTWNSTTNRNISGTATMISAGDTAISGSGSVVINQFGDVTSFTGTLTATVGGNLVATLTITGLSNESYSGYNTSSRIAGITLNYAQDSNSTLINSPTLGALSNTIFAGYSLTAVSLSGSADPVYGTNEQAISISGTGTLGALGGVTISGTIYVDTDGNGIPNAGETASTLTVVHTATSTTVATITISGFAFNGNFASLLASGVNSISGARVYVNTWDGGGSTIDAQVTGLANSSGGSLTLRGWTITFTSAFSSGVANFPDNVGNGAIGASGVATISDGLGTSYTGVTISGTVYVYSDNVFAISDLASNHGGSASSASATVGGQGLGISIGNISIT